MSFWRDFKVGMIGYNPTEWVANYILNKRGLGMGGITTK